MDEGEGKEGDNCLKMLACDVADVFDQQMQQCLLVEMLAIFSPLLSKPTNSAQPNWLICLVISTNSNSNKFRN